jgi:uncharacterized membrane protein
MVLAAPIAGESAPQSRPGVDDAGFALTILVWLTACALLLPRVPLALAWHGVLLFAGLAVILVWHCLRHIARRAAPVTS